MTRRKYRSTDKNQPQIVAAIQACGWSWMDTNVLAEGKMDGVAYKWIEPSVPGAYPYKMVLIEIKNPEGKHYKKDNPLSPAEFKFHARHPGLIQIIWTPEQVTELLRKEDLK